MITSRTALALLATSLIGLSACGAQQPSDTGYVGTWVRGSAEHAQSTLSIVRDGERYRVRWTLATADARWKVTCTWDGPCEEFTDGEKVASYSFSTSIDPQSGHLVVECNGKKLSGEGDDLHWVDEFILKRKGLKLVTRALEQGDQVFEGEQRPRRTFTKVSDTVVDPPPAHTGSR